MVLGSSDGMISLGEWIEAMTPSFRVNDNGDFADDSERGKFAEFEKLVEYATQRTVEEILTTLVSLALQSLGD